MLDKIFMTKYVDLGSPIVDVHIDNTFILNTLIDLGDTINVMTKETIDKLRLLWLCQIPIVLQMVDRSTIKLEGIL